MAAATRANDILILLDSANAGPDVDIHSYYFPTWILWPPTDETGANRIEAIASGVTWRSDYRDSRFISEESGYRSLNYDSLRKRGYFEVRNRFLADSEVGLIQRNDGSVDVNVLLMALNGSSSVVQPTKLQPHLGVAHARTWDDASDLASMANGKALVLEYPPPDGLRWSRYWLRGKGWPRSQIPMGATKVPGLLDCTETMQILIHPDSFRWVTDQVDSWGGANRWLEHVRYVGPWILALTGSLAAAVIVTAAIFVMKEKGSDWVGRMLIATSLIPPALILCGNACRRFGLNDWPIWLSASYLLLVTSDLALRRLVLKRSHPIASIAIISLAVVLISDPGWSVFSSTLGWNRNNFSSDALGLLLAYTTYLVSVSPKILAITLPLVFVSLGLATHSWWWNGFCLSTLLIAWVCTRPGFKPWMTSASILLAVPVIAVKGVCWAPASLIQVSQEMGRINLAEHLQFLVSPLFASTVGLCLFVSLFGNRFFWRQLRLLLRQDPRRWSLVHAAIVCFGLGLAWPSFLMVGLYVLLGALIVLLHDAVITL